MVIKKGWKFEEETSGDKDTSSTVEKFNQFWLHSTKVLDRFNHF